MFKFGLKSCLSFVEDIHTQEMLFINCNCVCVCTNIPLMLLYISRYPILISVESSVIKINSAFKIELFSPSFRNEAFNNF